MSQPYWLANGKDGQMTNETEEYKLPDKRDYIIPLNPDYKKIADRDNEMVYGFNRCLDLVTPIFNGMKTELSQTNIMLTEALNQNSNLQSQLAELKGRVDEEKMIDYLYKNKVAVYYREIVTAICKYLRGEE